MKQPSIDELLKEIKELEDKISLAIEEKSADLKYKLIARKVVFEKEIQKQHKRLASSLTHYIANAQIGNIVVSPIIYSMIFPAILMDFFVTVFQMICFPMYQISKVKRSDYIVMDRNKLKYLNLIEKFNCLYCGYFNGVIGYAREIAARTEQYWCPIKHSRSPKGRHDHYHQFQDFGDPENLKSRLEELRRKLSD